MRSKHSHTKPLKTGSLVQPLQPSSVLGQAQFWAKLWGQSISSALAIKALALSPEDQMLPGTRGFCKEAKALVGCQEPE